MVSFRYNYSFFCVDIKEDEIAASVQKYNALRLKTPLPSSTAFSLTYKIESAFADVE
jgi:hypothetical protein